MCDYVHRHVAALTLYVTTTALVARREEGGMVKRVLKVKKEDLDKILSTKKSPKKTAGILTAATRKL